MGFIKIKKVIGENSDVKTKYSTIPTDEIKDSREYYPKEYHKETLGADIEMTRIYFKDGGDVDILESYENFSERLGAIPIDGRDT